MKHNETINHPKLTQFPISMELVVGKVSHEWMLFQHPMFS